jgi:hypothetical protein
MIAKIRPLLEAAEYIGLTLHRSKEIAELQFVRPNGTPISVTIPVAQLSDLQVDIAQKYPEALGGQLSGSGLV